MTETELLQDVLDAAAEIGVLAFHSWDSRHDRGDPGFPDLVLAGQSIEFWELKTATGTVSPEQWAWIRRLKSAGVTVRIIRPDDNIRAYLRVIRGK